MSDIPIVIFNGSKMPYISIGTAYGGINYCGHEYTYLPDRDAFLLSSLVKKYIAFNRKFRNRGGFWEEFIKYLNENNERNKTKKL